MPRFAPLAFLVLTSPIALMALDPEPEPEPEPEDLSTSMKPITFSSYQSSDSQHGIKHLPVPHGTFYTEAEACEAEVGISVGHKFYACLIARLRKEGSLAQFGDHELTDYFTALEDSNELKAALRNFTCSMDDNGSQPIEKINWNYDGAAACAEEAGRGVAGGFKMNKGFLPAGNDHPTLSSQEMTVGEAKKRCKADQSSKPCKGFTFVNAEGLEDGVPVDSTRAMMYFKTEAANVGGAADWFSYKIVKPQQCSADDKPVSYNVDVISLDPYVAVVREFATADECEYLKSVAESNGIQRSTVGGTGTTTTSIDRSSSSANMVPDLDDLQVLPHNTISISSVHTHRHTHRQHHI
jgi:hypothetical protein